jgi:hypothetical protein
LPPALLSFFLASQPASSSSVSNLNEH